MSDRQENVLPAIYVGAQPPPGKDPIGGGFDRTSKPGFQPAVGINLHKLKTTASTLAEEYKTLSNQLPQTIENELAATRLEGPTNPLPPAEAIIRELGVRNKLLIRKTAEFHYKTAIANEFYGFDPIDRPLQEFYPKALTLEKVVVPDGIAMQAWATSYRAAHDARLLSQTIQLLNQQSVNVQNFLRAVQADDQARMAAEQEAQRVAAELARINAQAEARAREQARVAALAEAQRLANEQAEAAAKAAAQHIAAEQARLAELAEAQRQAELLRLETEQQEILWAQERLRQDALKTTSTYPASGASAASRPVISFASTVILLAPETSIAIITALRSALIAAGAAALTMLGPVLVGFAALLVPSRLGNSERLAMSIPLAELAPVQHQKLWAIAAESGGTDLPMRIGFKPTETGIEVFVATTDGVKLPSTVPVRLATYDAQLNVYRVTPPNSSTSTLTWTPAVTPGNSSTQLPVAQPDLPVYPGATVVPVEGRIDRLPALVTGWENFITVFPDDSAIPPLYVVFSSPYDGATATGEHSGRDFNPDQAGGPIQDLEWSSAIISQGGIDLVKLHTGRLAASDANNVMIERLEKILKGELDFTDIDKRYYTHETRELDRFRALGYSDTDTPQQDSPTWNNAHTAALEDYKVKDDNSLLYTEEALAAADEQDRKYFQSLLKDMQQ